MDARSRRASLVIVALTAWTAAVPASAQARPGSETALRRRVVQLEDRVAQLEREMERMRELSRAQAPALVESSAPRPASAYLILSDREGWRRRESWRRLRRGLSQLEVRRILGEPDRVVVDRFTALWIYPAPGARVAFGLEGGRVEGWVEP